MRSCAMHPSSFGASEAYTCVCFVRGAMVSGPSAVVDFAIEPQSSPLHKAVGLKSDDTRELELHRLKMSATRSTASNKSYSILVYILSFDKFPPAGSSR